MSRYILSGAPLRVNIVTGVAFYIQNKGRIGKLAVAPEKFVLACRRIPKYGVKQFHKNQPI
jgi:hypothetical protein